MLVLRNGKFMVYEKVRGLSDYIHEDEVPGVFAEAHSRGYSGLTLEVFRSIEEYDPDLVLMGWRLATEDEVDLERSDKNA